ncbi:MAG: inorganic phosphate transporter [bacterium]|nr:inorganic phosphate transporter [bacterium]
MPILLVALVVFFALNMGASGIAPSFAAPVGASFMRKREAVALFSLFVVLGAILLGRRVSLTLGRDLLEGEHLTHAAAAVIIAAAAAGLLIANLAGIPQSTSQVTVGAIAGVGLGVRHFSFRMLAFRLLPAWILLPVASFVLTYSLYRAVYPPRDGNLRLHERILVLERRLRAAAVVAGCYVAFAIGTNNVANAAGPLSGAGLLGVFPALAAVSPLFGAGAWLLGGRPLETAGTEIVPLGLLSATLVAVVTATLLIAASLLGIPQSLVQLNMGSLFAVACIKNGGRHTFRRWVTRKTAAVWLVTPVVAACISYALTRLLLVS